MKTPTSKRVNDTFFVEYFKQRGIQRLNNGFYLERSHTNDNFMFHFSITTRSSGKHKKMYLDFCAFNLLRAKSFKTFNPTIMLHPMHFFKELNEELRWFDIDTESELEKGVSKIKFLFENKYFKLMNEFDVPLFLEFTKKPIYFFHDTFNTLYEYLYSYFASEHYDLKAIKELIAQLKQSPGRSKELNEDVLLLEQLVSASSLDNLKQHLLRNKEENIKLLFDFYSGGTEIASLKESERG